MWITNNGKEDVSWSWDGKETILHPGECKEIPEHVAQSEFGFGEENKIPALIRRGWVKTSLDHEKALQRLAAFVFTKEPQGGKRAGRPSSAVPSPAAEVSE